MIRTFNKLNENQKNIVYLFVLAAAVFAVYFPGLQNGFTNWDDVAYISNNKLIQDLSFEKIPLFFTEPVVGNFHPLTMFSLAIDYNFLGTEPFYFHLHNTLLHIFNTLLVFVFIYLLSNKNVFVAFFTALVFGVHPMHVESVAWASERKDVLYSFYFLLGLISYLKYYDDVKWKKFGIPLLFFVLSGMAKSAAVVFPLVLVLIDLFKRKKIEQKLLTEKALFFIVAITFGLLAIYTQKDAGALSDLGRRTIGERIVFGSYGFVFYIAKYFIPLKLTAIYQIPAEIPDYYRACAFVVFPFLGFLFYKIYKGTQNRYILGMMFYFLTLILVLQIVSVGYAVVAERYTYIPYIGLGFITFLYLDKYIKKSGSKKFVILMSVFVLGIFGMMAQNRVKVWENSETLWNDALKTDITNHTAYNNLGNYFTTDSTYDKAIYYFSRAIKAKPNFYLAFINRGAIYFEQKKYQEALNDFNQVVALGGANDRIVRARQVCMQKLGITEDKLAGQLPTPPGSTGSADAAFNRGMVLYNQKKYSEAIPLFKQAIENDDAYDFASYQNIGLALKYLDRNAEAIFYFDEAIKLKPNSFMVYYHRGLANFNLGEYEKALNDYSTSIKLGNNTPGVYRQRAYLYFEGKAYNKSAADYTKLISLEPNKPEYYYHRSINYWYLKDYKKAKADADKAISMGYSIDDSYMLRLNRLIAK